MNIFQLECFLAVANYLNFARAAEQLNISQPAVSHQIRSLENALNVKLFNRSTRFVELTMEGMAFLDDARNIVGISQKAMNRFLLPETQKTKPLTIGCTGMSQMDMLPEVIRQLIKKHPFIHPNVQLHSRTRLLSKVEDGLVDVALGMKDTKSKKRTLVYRELTKTPVTCLCQPDHPLTELKHLTINDIKPYKFILYNPIVADPETAHLQQKIAEDKSPADLFFCESAEEAITLIDSGIGVSILPNILVPRIYNLSALIIENVNSLSFGLYYKPYPGNTLTKEFVQVFFNLYSHIPAIQYDVKPVQDLPASGRQLLK